MMGPHGSLQQSCPWASYHLLYQQIVHLKPADIRCGLPAANKWISWRQLGAGEEMSKNRTWNKKKFMRVLQAGLLSKLHFEAGTCLRRRGLEVSWPQRARLQRQVEGYRERACQKGESTWYFHEVCQIVTGIE